MNHVAKKQQGFTIIELSLAMTFVSLLLLGIAMSIIQIGAIYNKGTTLKDINQAARDIDDDISRSISSSSSIVLATDYVLTPTAANPAGGRLCLGSGSYSYIWNYAKTPASNAAFADYERAPDGSKPTDPIRLVRVPDSGKIYCAKNAAGGLANKNIRGVDVPQAQELIKAGDHDLGLRHFRFITPSPVPASAVDPVSKQQLYSLSYTIGTSTVSALNATQTACLAPNITNADPLYCNIQEFSLVVRAGSKVN